MQTIDLQNCEELQQKNTVVALGFFDGLHIGHQAVINNATSYAIQNNFTSAVFTFTYKNTNIKCKKGKMLLSYQQRKKRIQSLNVDYYICPSFTDICTIQASDFVQGLLKQKLNAKAVFCGENFTFGKNASGNVEYLKTECAKHGIEVFVLDMQSFENQTASSTCIKQHLQDGEIEKVNKMLLFPYCVDFTVLKGKGIGKTFGFPTINQHFSDDMVVPKHGVYITKTYIDGKAYISATGIGNRPTVNGENITCETFILDYNGDLYGKKPKVEFYKYIAPIIRFENVEQLAENVRKYAQKAKEYFE